MSRKPGVAELVAELAGLWAGEGAGEYPTIESFSYREITEIVENPTTPLFDSTSAPGRGPGTAHRTDGLDRAGRSAASVGAVSRRV